MTIYAIKIGFTLFLCFRIGADIVGETVRKLSTGRVTWEEVTQKFPKFEAQETKSEISEYFHVCFITTLFYPCFKIIIFYPALIYFVL